MKKRVATYLSAEQHAALVAMSHETDIPIARLVARAVAAFIEARAKTEEVMPNGQ